MKRPVAEPCAPAHANSITVSDEDRPAVEEIAAGYDNQAKPHACSEVRRVFGKPQDFPEKQGIRCRLHIE